MFLSNKLRRVIEDYALIDDPQERLALIVDRAKTLVPLSPAERIDANRVRGCVSVVWLVGELRGNRCFFRSDAESPVVRGLVAFLCDFFTGAPAAEIASSEIEPLEALDLLRNLSPTRRNGLAAARQAIRAFAARSPLASGSTLGP